MPDDFDRDQPDAANRAYIGWRRTLSYPIYSVEDAERAIQDAFVYAWRLRSAGQWPAVPPAAD